MTEPTGALPTAEEIATLLFASPEISDQSPERQWAGAHGGAQVFLLKKAEALLARLRPAWDLLHDKAEQGWNAAHLASQTSANAIMERDALRAALAKKEEELSRAADIANCWAREAGIEEAHDPKNTWNLIERLWINRSFYEEALRREVERIKIEIAESRAASST